MKYIRIEELNIPSTMQENYDITQYTKYRCAVCSGSGPQRRFLPSKTHKAANVPPAKAGEF